MSLLISFAAAYLAGSIPFGFLIGWQVKGIDLRAHGSKNIGTTNAFRVLGKKWGGVVFFLDSLKGAVAVLIPQCCLGVKGLPLLTLLGAAAVAGHAFPVWLKFKGGKGVATSLGVFLALTPKPALAALAIWTTVFLAAHIVSLSSLAAAVSFPAAILFFYRGRPDFVWLFAAALLLMFFIFFTHRANIRRLLKGEERRLF